MKTWICPVCRIGESVQSDIHKEGARGKKSSIEPTIFHPTLNPRKKL